MLERLQKILSARGIASRRKAEEYIVAGLVTVNGKPAILGQKADPEKDRIEVGGKVLSDRAEMLYYVMNKPVGVETSNVDSSSRLSVSPKKQENKETRSARSVQAKKHARTVRDMLPAHLQCVVYPVGRLDKDSGGLLLFTNDGPLAYRLTHPAFDHEKEYDVTVASPLPAGALAKLETGLMIDGSKTKPAVVTRISPTRFRISITEGRNRQIRRMCQKVGSTVKILTRIRIMTLADESLMPGKLRKLTDAEKQALLRSVGL